MNIQRKKKNLIIFGARPEAIKLAPLVNQFLADNRFETNPVLNKFKVTIKLYLPFILFPTSQRCGFFYKKLNKSTCKTFEQLRASIVSIRQFFLVNCYLYYIVVRHTKKRNYEH
jgi:hypothetical protein